MVRDIVPPPLSTGLALTARGKVVVVSIHNRSFTFPVIREVHALLLDPFQPHPFLFPHLAVAMLVMRK
jgi:hypothetical protein